MVEVGDCFVVVGGGDGQKEWWERVKPVAEGGVETGAGAGRAQRDAMEVELEVCGPWWRARMGLDGDRVGDVVVVVVAVERRREHVVDMLGEGSTE